MAEAPELIKIGAFARLAGTNLRTLRYYEELGLLMPSHRSEGGFRYYRDADRHRLEAIRVLQDLGLPLDSIRALLDTRSTRGDRAEVLRRVRLALEEEDRLLQEGLEKLHRQRTKVGAALEKLQECRPCPHTPGLENNYCEPCRNTGLSLPELLSALF